MSKLKNIFWTIFIFALLLPVNNVFAAHGPGHDTELKNPLKFNTISEFLIGATDAFIKIAFPIVVLMVIYSGFLFVVAQGNEDKLKTAKSTIMWTIIGALIVLSATVLVNAISGTVDDIRYGGASEYEKTETLKRYGLPTKTKEFDPTQPESVFNPRN